jgi:hypothetical protein
MADRGKCLGVYPPIISTHVVAGDKSKESDSKVLSGVNKVAITSNLVYPARLNVGLFVNGGTKVKSQYPGDTIFAEVDTGSFELPSGKPVLVTKEDYEGNKTT